MKYKATPESIIQYGKIAAVLREWCEKNNKGPADINAIIGKPRGYTAAYHWLGAKGAPRADYAKLLSEGTGIPVEQLTRYHIDGSLPPAPTVPVKYSKVSDILSFTVTDSGEARIKLDVTLPIDMAAPLFRMILDAGIVMEKNDG